MHGAMLVWAILDWAIHVCAIHVLPHVYGLYISCKVIYVWAIDVCWPYMNELYIYGP